MSDKKQFTIQEFAHLTGIKRDNLRFYDRIGLLSPETRGDNKYRYYTRMQLSKAYLIFTLRSLDVSLDEIREYLNNKSCEHTLAFFLQQRQRVDEEIKRLQVTKGIIELYTQFVQEISQHPNNEIFLKEKKQESIFLCPIISDSMDDDEACILAYDYASEHHINTGHPLGAVICKEDIMENEVDRIHRYYFLLKKGKKDVKAEGLYAVAYCNSSMETMTMVYRRLMEFIKNENLMICGDAYEEYLLDDFAFPNQSQHNVRIEVPVSHLCI